MALKIGVQVSKSSYTPLHCHISVILDKQSINILMKEPQQILAADCQLTIRRLIFN
jgi:hypothetical protein